MMKTEKLNRRLFQCFVLYLKEVVAYRKHLASYSKWKGSIF